MEKKSRLRPETHVVALAVHGLAAWPWDSHRILPALRFVIKEIRGGHRGLWHLKGTS